MSGSTGLSRLACRGRIDREHHRARMDLAQILEAHAGRRAVGFANERGDPAAELEVPAGLPDGAGGPVGDHPQPVGREHRRPAHQHREQELEIAGIRRECPVEEDHAEQRPKHGLDRLSARSPDPTGRPRSSGRPRRGRAASAAARTAARRRAGRTAHDRPARAPRIARPTSARTTAAPSVRRRRTPRRQRTGAGPRRGYRPRARSARNAGYAAKATWKPRSTGRPSCQSVRARPPGPDSASITRSEYPARASRTAQASPATPAPTTTTSTLMCSCSFMRRCYQWP